MKKAIITFIVAAALAFAIPVYATDEPGMKSDSQRKTGITQDQTGQMQYGQRVTADELEGMDVVSQNGEKIGEIEKITGDRQSGPAQFVILSRGGILGMGAEKIAVPLSAFEIRDDKARLTVDESKLKNVPEQRAEVTDSDYLRDLETHYGVAPAWKGDDLGNTPKNQKMDQNSTEPRKKDIQN